MINRIDDNVWTIDGPDVVFAGVPVPTRMTVIRLQSQQLWVHSPIARSDAVREAIAQIGGTVGVIVAPNKFHHLFVQQWCTAYPDAAVFADPDLQRKVPRLASAETLIDAPPPAYREDLDQQRVAGNLYFNEFVFFHRNSRSLIVTDLLMNLRTEHQSWLARRLLSFEGVVFPNGGVSTLYRWLSRDKAGLRDALDTIREWGPARILLCHGEPFDHDVDQILAREFAYLR